MAAKEGLEPPPAVLETVMLPLHHSDALNSFTRTEGKGWSSVHVHWISDYMFVVMKGTDLPSGNQVDWTKLEDMFVVKLVG